MNQESILITNLPPEIIITILSRLPIRTVVACKLVCKPWLELLETREFANSHLSKSVPGLAVYHYSDLFRIFEIKDEPDLEHHELHYNLVTEFKRTSFINPSHCSIGIEGSANGLLFLREINSRPHVHYICNPITRDYIELQAPDGVVHFYPTIKTYGFGTSKITRENKVVRILHIPKSECHVYTLGTGAWRKIAYGSKLEYNCRSVGAYLNGNLHWLVVDLKGSYWISCFDLETELFSTFRPPRAVTDRRDILGGLFVLGDCLCLCDNTSEDEIVIWLMKEYGDEKSWSKEYVINKHPDHAGECYEVVRPMKVFKDGDILMSWQDFFLFCYSNKTKIISHIDMFRLPYTWGIDSMLHTSSFLSLKDFTRENVRSF
ncbi:F-box protein cpr30 [Phtheirospermum japonicum]|uniref:F-box protein cpr30 n=1 Tax=Phtheirospermum japonicum TaxID=374723 RepID=A0A830B3F1_9LAMI|nr:F-box protein cpr30 [Phtheirospermum japonicum]